MAEPTPYDLEQDARIETIESLVTAEYQPPAGVEYSFPVANQGITQEQFRLMHLGQANGMIHGDNGVVNDSPNSTGYRYYIEGHDSDSETNQRNTLILRAGTSAESIVEGFYHRLTEDMELPFPPVTTTTLYRVTLTYDPRKFKTSPVNIEVWNAEPPTAHGQIHLLLHTVERRPNQLLSQSTITRYRQYTAGLLSVQNVSQLPDVDSVPAGTLAIPTTESGTGAFVRSNTSPKRWLDLFNGEWKTLSPATGNGVTGSASCRHEPTGLRVRATLTTAGMSNISNSLFRLPTATKTSDEFYTVVPGSRGPITIQTDSGLLRIYNSGSVGIPGWIRMNFLIPNHYFV